MSNEPVHAAEWIVTTLEGDVTLAAMITGAYMDLIPADVDLPAVRFHVANTHDIRGAGTPAHRIMVQIDWLVAVVRQGHGLADILPIADRVDALLHNSNGETSTVKVLSCVRLEPFEMLEPETESGVRYRHVGGLYRTLVQSK